ncbi:MAG: response regulator, partial [Armatimonadota bacterium]
MEDSGISLFLIEPRVVVRRGLKDILSSSPGIVVVGEAESISKARAVMSRISVNVLVMDIECQEAMDIPSTTDAKCLAFSDCQNWEFIKLFLSSGGAGYLSKTASEAHIIAAIRKVASGKVYQSP